MGEKEKADKPILQMDSLIPFSDIQHKMGLWHRVKTRNQQSEAKHQVEKTFPGGITMETKEAQVSSAEEGIVPHRKSCKQIKPNPVVAAEAVIYNPLQYMPLFQIFSPKMVLGSVNTPGQQD